MAEAKDSNIKQEGNTAAAGMNLERSTSQIPKGSLSYALNATVEGFDKNNVSYQNELGSELYDPFPRWERHLFT